MLWAEGVDIKFKIYYNILALKRRRFMMNNNNTMYIKSDLTKKEIAEIVNLSIDSIYASKIINSVKNDNKKPMVKKLVQNHSNR